MNSGTELPALQREQLIRYSRHIMLRDFGVAGQQRLIASRALVIGMGGLGSPATMYLAACGVGRLAIVDFDRVELSNLQRQVIHGTPDVGRLKVDSAFDRIGAINPEVAVEKFDHALDEAELGMQVENADVVVDCSDNFATRFAINAACVKAGRPLVSAAAIRFEAQIAVFANLGDSACYRCLYDDAAVGQETCAANGVASPMLGIVGAMQALEAIKVLVGIQTGLAGRLLILDALRMEWNSVRLRRDPACPVCGQLNR
jgi:adenylyltransferase/sulfurtransferase